MSPQISFFSSKAQLSGVYEQKLARKQAVPPTCRSWITLAAAVMLLSSRVPNAMNDDARLV
ncbi:hypothetical protein [Adlercreutzia sp. ZJ473]|uniref:hypothetical protein n=1 Tax=Adlercreutzia sp. ZJ473 TaxID=2722822 RepID=UPI001551AABE|nr:hypothetical protein [Adlercreutzia sp. ZJ473]